MLLQRGDRCRQQASAPLRPALLQFGTATGSRPAQLGATKGQVQGSMSMLQLPTVAVAASEIWLVTLRGRNSNHPRWSSECSRLQQ